MARYAGEDKSCVSGTTANIVKFFASGEAHAAVLAIDGLRVQGFPPFCVVPGPHRIGVHFENNLHISEQNIELNMEAAKNYKIRAVREGLSFRARIFEIRGKQEVLLREEVVDKTGERDAIPIMVPN